MGILDNARRQQPGQDQQHPADQPAHAVEGHLAQDACPGEGSGKGGQEQGGGGHARRGQMAGVDGQPGGVHQTGHDHLPDR